jgi:hypothetical protein
MSEQTIKCPKCGHKFPVTEALTAQITSKLKEEFETASREREKIVKEEYAQKLNLERGRLLKAAQKEAEELASKKLVALREQLSVQRKELERTRAKEEDVQRRERALNAKERDIESAIAEKVELARKKAVRDATEKAELEHEKRDLQHEKVVSDLRKQLIDAKRKLDQGSQQTQGEAIELELERVLMKAFPEDKIKPIAKGRQGADVLQVVLGADGEPCGAIVWESKNTSTWSNAWLPKLRTDQRREKAELAVIVSTSLPKGVSRFAQIGGVWVADFSVAVGLAAALRANLIDLAQAKLSAQSGKSGKMQILYEYLMSTEFRQRVEAIVEAFTNLNDDLSKERESMQRFWAKREKQLQLVLQNVSGMVGDIQAISPAFPRIKRLELPPATRSK